MTFFDIDQKLTEFNRQGLIPGPDENEKDFFERVEYCFEIKKHLKDHIEGDFDTDNQTLLSEAQPNTLKYYDIVANWVPILFDNHKLSFWHGGCAWIFQLEEHTSIAAILQLKKKLKQTTSLYGIFDRKEIITHETAHIGRMAFNEPKFEEILAYRSSDSCIRSKIGAIAQNSKESGLFALSLIVILMLDLFFVMSGYESFYNTFMWLKLIPLGMIAYGLARLTKRQCELDSCLSNLALLITDPSKSLAIAYRLTDEEIKKFASIDPKKILEYAHTQAELSLRWRLIKSEYLTI